MKHAYRLLLLLTVVAALEGCRSSRHATREKAEDTTATVVTGQAATTSGTEGAAEQGEQTASALGITAKMKVRLEAGGKGVNCGGSCRLLRDDVVQVELTYSVLFVTLNVGTLELTKDHILLLDKMNNRYCQATYDEIPELKAAGVDFFYLQDIFWGEAEGKKNAYVDWKYGNWTQVGGSRFPQEMTLTMNAKNATSLRAAFEFSKVQQSTDWKSRTKIPSDYEQVSLSAVTNAIMKVVK